MSPLLALRKGNDAHTFLAATSAQTAKASKTLSLPTLAANTDPFGSSPCNFIVNASSECLSMCVFKYHDCMLKLLRCVSSYCIYQSYIARWWSIMSKLFYNIKDVLLCIYMCASAWFVHSFNHMSLSHLGTARPSFLVHRHRGEKARQGRWNDGDLVCVRTTYQQWFLHSQHVLVTFDVCYDMCLWRRER